MTDSAVGRTAIAPEPSQCRIKALLDAHRELREENRRLNEWPAAVLGERHDARRVDARPARSSPYEACPRLSQFGFNLRSRRLRKTGRRRIHDVDMAVAFVVDTCEDASGGCREGF